MSSNHGSDHENSQQRPNSIGIRGRALESLLNELDDQVDRSGAYRKFHRWPHRLERVFIKIRQPGGQDTVIRVVCRNISQGGMAILHNSFIHPGSRCAVILPHLTQGPTPVLGKIVRCQHRRGLIHELGISFETPINIRDYIPREGVPALFALERVDPAQLEGCLVVVDPDDLDLRVIQHFLRLSRVRLRHARNAMQAVEMVRDGCDLILVNQQLGDTSGIDVIAQLKAERMNLPVVMYASDVSKASMAESESAGVDALLAKPLTQDTFLRTLGDFLLNERDGRPKTTPSAGRPGVDDARRIASSLAKGLAHGDMNLCRRACMELLSADADSGLAGLGDIAAEAAAAMTSANNLELSRAKIEALIDACLSHRPAA
ncbi:MAG: response regulator [Phycisphaeraceae bacterium]|nr:response regulator [Phycisphaeraceae bacterium]MCW5753190.1 response regulator [Phycisphaeraceae bacterium]